MTKKKFNPVTEAVLTRLAEAVGPENVRTDDEALEIYASDETEDLVFPPEVVVLPTTADALARVMTIAWQEDIAVTP